MWEGNDRILNQFNVITLGVIWKRLINALREDAAREKKMKICVVIMMIVTIIIKHFLIMGFFKEKIEFFLIEKCVRKLVKRLTEWPKIKFFKLKTALMACWSHNIIINIKVKLYVWIISWLAAPYEIYRKFLCTLPVAIAD